MLGSLRYNRRMAQTHTPQSGFTQHVGDLEEWNEDAGFVWGEPTVVYTENLVVVVHPHTYPALKRHEPAIHSTAVAVYLPDGTNVALWLIDGDGTGAGVDFNYWTTPGANRAFVERTAIFRGREASVGDTVWDEKTDRVWTCTRVIDRRES